MTGVRARRVACAATALLAAAALAAGPAGCRVTTVEAPLCAGCNVVLISMDTLRADHVGAYGYGPPTTPNIDGLAARAAVFEDAVSQSAWTRPAHFSMLTGLYPVEHGVVSMSGPGRLPPSVTTLAEALAARGYATAGFTGGANLAEHFGIGRGFGRYESAGKRMLDNLDTTIAWLDENAPGKFFLFFHGLDPHRPYVAEAEDRRALGLPVEPARGWQQACQRGERPDDLRPYIGNYDAAIHRGDRAVGRLLARLAALDVMDDTVIVFTSDHGEEFFEHGRCYHIYTLYGEVLRVPLIIYVPRQSPRRIAGVVPASAAVGPTILALVGGDGPSLPGPSLDALLRGGSDAFDFVVSETSSRWRPGRPFGHVRTLTTDHEKLVHWLEEDRYEQFDLLADPGELRPVASSRRVVELSERLNAWLQSHRPWPRPRARRPEDSLPADLKRELESLGYLD